MSRFSTCTCHPANWSGEDKEERGVSHIRAFSGGQFMSGSNETSLSPPPSQLCNSDVSQTGKTKLYPFGGTRNWPCVQTKSKRLALLCFGWAFFFFIFTHQAFQVISSFKYSIKTEQKTFTHMLLDTDLHTFWIHTV